MDAATVATVALSIFLVMNPFSSLPTFISMTQGHEGHTIRDYANKAVLVAGVLLFVFVIIGSPLMSAFGVTMESFRVAGGLILILMAVELVFGLKLSNVKDEKDAPWIIVATPIMTGPGVITAAILFSEQYGMAEVMVAGFVALVATWALLRMAPTIMRLIGEKVLSIMSRIVGLLLAALGVEYMFGGAVDWMAIYGHATVAIGSIL